MNENEGGPNVRRRSYGGGRAVRHAIKRRIGHPGHARMLQLSTHTAFLDRPVKNLPAAFANGNSSFFNPITNWLQSFQGEILGANSGTRTVSL